MRGRPEVTDGDLDEVVAFLRRPEVGAEIHAEVPYRHRVRFETRYAEATGGHPLPPPESGLPYYRLRDWQNKWGAELRIYYLDVDPISEVVDNLTTDCGAWPQMPGHCRINSNNLVYRLFARGFILGEQDFARLARLSF